MNRRRAGRLWIRLGGCVAIAAALAGLAAVGVGAGTLAGFRERAADSLYPRGRTSPDVVVVAIDGATLAAGDQRWPWPRTEQARLLHAVAAGHPAVTVFDELFASAEPGDDQLATEIADAAPVVLAGVVSVSGSDHGVLVADHATGPDDGLARTAFAVGAATVTPDPNDGVVRSVPLTVEVDQAFVPSLALAAVAAVAGSAPDVVVRPGGVAVGTRTIPTDDLHRLRISWPEGLEEGDGTAVVSAAQVLAGRVDPQRFAGKAVFIGVTDPTLGDSHLTPLDRTAGQSGVLIQAAAYNTMVTRAYLTPASAIDVAVTVFVAALAVALAVQFLPLWAAALVFALSATGTVVLAFARAEHGTIADIVYVLAAIVAAVIASGALRYATETRRRREVARLFVQYVPEQVADRLMDQGRVETASAGQRLEVTVLFCDLRGFTSMAVEISPEAVNERLSRYYEFATAIVLEAGGTLVQYVGDEVFAVFGAPEPRTDHAAAAVACAARLQTERLRLDAELAAIGAPPLVFGVGLSSGSVVAAHAGSRRRRQYSVIGDTVNVGSRLCSQAEPGQVVLAESVRERIEPPPAVTPMGPLDMKGVSPDFTAWALVLERAPEPEPATPVAG